ncbi:PTS sugar transporter subunit IIB [Clostridium sp. C8]|nr:PTS sugar transporter subunit IIB [Clostridium sp. C8]
MKKRVLFVCATGIATSTAAAERVADYCGDRGINIEFTQCNVASVKEYDETVDLIISTTNVPYKLKTKVMNALPIITGFGEEEFLEEVEKVLRGEK